MMMMDECVRSRLNNFNFFQKLKDFLKCLLLVYLKIWFNQTCYDFKYLQYEAYWVNITMS